MRLQKYMLMISHLQVPMISHCLSHHCLGPVCADGNPGRMAGDAWVALGLFLGSLRVSLEFLEHTYKITAL